MVADHLAAVLARIAAAAVPPGVERGWQRLTGADLVAACCDRVGMVLLVPLVTLTSLVPMVVGTDPDEMFGAIALATVGGTLGGGDERGRVYLESRRLTPTPGQRDSAAVVRWTPATGGVDTLLWVAVPDVVVQQHVTGDGAARNVMNMVLPHPYGAGDEWAVAPRIGLVVVRWSPFLVERRPTEGRPVQRGPTIPYERQRTSAAERERSGGVASWPEFKPPFRAEFIALDAGGGVWLDVVSMGDRLPVTYLALTPDGRPRFRLSMAQGSRIAGFGARGVYVAEANEDGLYRIAQYSMPTAER